MRGNLIRYTEQYATYHCLFRVVILHSLRPRFVSVVHFKELPCNCFVDVVLVKAQGQNLLVNAVCEQAKWCGKCQQPTVYEPATVCKHGIL